MIISAETHLSRGEIMTKIHQIVRILAVSFQNQPDAEIIGSQLSFEGNLEPFKVKHSQSIMFAVYWAIEYLKIVALP